MNQLQELKERLPELAEKLVTMSKDELIERLAELEIYYDNHEFYKKEIESIVNWGTDWLEDNGKTNHYIHIEKGNIKVVQKEIIETTFI